MLFLLAADRRPSQRPKLTDTAAPSTRAVGLHERLHFPAQPPSPSSSIARASSQRLQQQTDIPGVDHDDMLCSGGSKAPIQTDEEVEMEDGQGTAIGKEEADIELEDVDMTAT